MTTDAIRLLMPEIALFAAAGLIYVAGAVVDARRPWSWIAGGGVLLAAVALWMQGPGATPGGPLAADPLAHYARWLALAVGGLLVPLASRRLPSPGTAEYVGSMVLAVAGMMLACAAGELILLFVGLQLVSIPTYVLLYLGRRGPASREAAAKCLFSGVLAAALLLCGLCFLYGATGSTDLDPANAGSIPARLAEPGGASAGFGLLVKVALVLIVAGLGFSIAAVPFNLYVPEVYQRTTHVNAAFLSVVPKAAGLVVLVRLVVLAMPTPPQTQPYAWRIVAVLAVLTMTLGNLAALRQDNLRRLLAFACIAHGGYMLMGLAAGLAPAHAEVRWDGVGALLFYLCAYAVAAIGAFAAVDCLGRRHAEVVAVDELAGLGRARPLEAAALAVFLFSLAGVPPLAGFWGKLAVVFSALGVAAEGGQGVCGWFAALAVIGVLNVAVAAAYCLRIVAVMYFRRPLAVPKAEAGAGAWLALAACALLTVLIGILPGPLLTASDAAGRGRRRTRMPPPQYAPSPEVAAGLSFRLVAGIQDGGDSYGVTPVPNCPQEIGNTRPTTETHDPTANHCHRTGQNAQLARPADLRPG